MLKGVMFGMSAEKNKTTTEVFGQDWVFEWVLETARIIGLLDDRAMKIVEHISKANTTNISEIAKHTSIPIASAHNVINKLTESKFIKISAYINPYPLGLRPFSVILTENKIGGSQKVLSALEDYCTYVSKGWSDGPQIYAQVMVPIGHENFLTEIFDEAIRQGLLSKYEAFPTTPELVVPISFENYNKLTKSWELNWSDLFSKFDSVSGELDDILRGGGFIRIWLDDVDTAMLKKFEVDAFVSLGDIHREMKGLSFQGIYYHYIHHIEKKKVITNLKVHLELYPSMLRGKIATVHTILIAQPKDTTALAKLVNTLKMASPFTKSIVKVLNANTMIAQFYFPVVELFSLAQALDKLRETGSLLTYRLLVLNTETIKHKGLPYDKFDQKSEEWVWNQDEKLMKIRGVI
ncbi:MAG: helix-turn-helix domain-containing protein [Thermoprotei archaeon]